MNDSETARPGGRGVLVIGLVASAWCLADLFSGSRVPVYRDLLFFFYPYRAFLAEHLARGDVPFWNPYVQLGVPFLASLHAGALYPPNILLLVPFPLGFNLVFLLHFAVAWSGVTFWLRGERMSPAGAATGALAFTIGGYLVSSVTNMAHLQTAAWAPWVLFSWVRFCRSGRGFTATALLLVVQLLGGAPEVWVSTLALLGAWTLFAAPTGFRARLRLAARLALCIGAAVALAAFQILPTVEYLASSRRASHLSPGELTYWSMNPVSLLQLLLPHSTALGSEAERWRIGGLLETQLPFVHSIYIGIAGICLAVAGTTLGPSRVFWGLVPVVGILLALGPKSPLYNSLFVLAPGVLGRIRYPEKFLFLFHLGAVRLVAQGATAVLGGERGALRVSATAAATLAGVALTVSVLGWTAPDRVLNIAAALSGRGDWPVDAFVESAADVAYKADRAVLLLLAWSGLVLLRLRERIAPPVFVLLAILLFGVDLAATHRGLWFSLPIDDLRRTPVIVDSGSLRSERLRVFHYQTTVAGRSVPGIHPWKPLVHERLDLRKFALQGWQTLFFATGMLHGVGVLSADDSIGRQTLLDEALHRLPRDRAIELVGRFGVGVLIGPDLLSGAAMESLPAPEGLFVYRISDPLPFAFLASEIEIERDPAKALDRLTAPEFRRGSRAIVDRVPEGWVPASGPVDPGERVLVRGGTDQLEIEVWSAATRLLVVNSSYFPGWKAEVDGRPAPIVRANALVQGIVVGPGRHVVRLAYRPASFRIGATLSVAALSIVVVTIHVGRRSRP